MRLLNRLAALFCFAALTNAAVLSVQPSLWAQGETTSAILGEVTDASNAVLPGATVTIINRDTGTKRSVRSDEGGRFNFPQLQPGIDRATDGLPSLGACLVVALRARSTRATSRMRTTRPVWSVFKIISANWSASISRPRVVIVYWKTCPGGTGGWPICPAATWTFCCWTANTTSLAERFARPSFRVEPEPHAVIALPEVGDVGPRRPAAQFVAKLDRGVVAQVEVVCGCRRARRG